MLTPFSVDEVNLKIQRTRYKVSTKCGEDKTFYRFGFNGQEKDNEIKGKGNVMNYEYRVQDTRSGRFYSVDPLAYKFPFWSPYHFAGNTPLRARELEGAETHYTMYLEDTGNDIERLEARQQINKTPVLAMAMLFGGALSVGFSVAPYATAAFIGEEALEDVFERFTGIPVVIDPVDVIEKAAKEGTYKEIKGIFKDKLKDSEKKRLAENLEEGSLVKRINENKKDQLPDFEIDGKKTEFKALNSDKLNFNTAVTNIQDAFEKEGVQVIDLDIRKPGGVTLDAFEIAKRFEGTKQGKSYTGKLNIVTKQGKVEFDFGKKVNKK